MKEIEYLFCDIDGCITDGKYYIGPNSIMKSFYTRDFHALMCAITSGIKVVFITKSADECIKEQVKRLTTYSRIWNNAYISGYIDLIINSENKLEDMCKYLKIDNITKDERIKKLAYVGDADNDLECMQVAGFTACPSDAMSIIKEESNFISNYPGGNGAIEEIINYILEKRTQTNG